MVKIFLAQKFFFIGIDILRGVKMWESEGFVNVRYGALSGSKLNVQTFSSLNFETNLFAYNYFLIAALF